MQEIQEMQFQSLGWEDSVEKGMATHSSILAWSIPWTEKPGRLTVHWVQSQIQLNRLSMRTCMKIVYYQVSFRYPSHMYIAHKSCICITANCGKFLKRLDYQTTFLPPEKCVCRSRSNSYNQAWNNKLV